MAQAGFTPIQLYYSATTTNVPSAGNLAAGELAINTADGKLFYKDSSNVVQVIATKAGASGDVVGPASATDGNLAAFDGVTGKLIKQASTVTVAQGGTGLNTFAALSIPVANTLNTLSALSAAAGQSVRVNAGGTAWEAYTPASGSGDVTGPGSSVSGNIATFNGTTGKIIQDGGKALPTGTIVGTTDTQTLTNKRFTPRVNIQTTTASPWAWNSDSFDQQGFTALANALTINADAGTPTDGQRTILRFKDNGTGRALTWTTGSSNSFRAIGVTLPTTTVANKTTYVGCVYNSADARWDAVAVTTEA